MQTKYPGKTMPIAIKNNSGWQINPYIENKEAAVLKKNEIEPYLYQTDLAGPLYQYKAKGNEISLIGKEKVEGDECYVLYVKYKNGYGVKIYMSAKNYQIKRIRDKFREVNYSDYQKYGGILLPNATEIKTGNVTMLFSFTKVKINPKINMNIFNFPKK
ncbi:hypothetical protein [Sphingobacterium zeae]|uniref:Uncharacterized protein n=1 Tax=Sphingobacterium zeae TaxID=1776859 RepID=A0ABU0TZU7_9SPHI|nr:hypothetical protein [Sphingobacterium zeae]MDQ1148234.1 hypothetical protein [Sphingobacterium zeae]